MGDFYRAFEERHRGSREDIKERLRVYLPFIRPLPGQYPQATALDLGCGRGEWLELLTEEGFRAKGVDQDKGMLAACTALDLDVEAGDAIEHLKSLPDESTSVVSAFHLVEHIDFDSLMCLVKHALRVLLPGGILILETPNPENLVVGTRNFYLDPTHIRPIPPQLLEFVVEYCNFERIKVMRLQEASELHDPDTEIRLIDVLSGVSPDYSIVAQKKCEDVLKSMFDGIFMDGCGLTLDELAARYDTGMQTSVRQLDVHSNQYWRSVAEILHRLVRMQQQTSNKINSIHTEIGDFSHASGEREDIIDLLKQNICERDIKIAALSQELGERDARINEFSQMEVKFSGQVDAAEHEIQHLRLAYEQSQMELNSVRDELSELYASTSWKIIGFARWLRKKSLKADHFQARNHKKKTNT